MGCGEPVLVVDDDASVRESLGQLLTLLNYRPSLAAGKAEALDLASQQAFRLLLCDVQLADAHGPEVAGQLASHFSPLGVVLMSGYAPVEAQLQRKASHGLAYLQKPFDIATLARTLRQVLEAH